MKRNCRMWKTTKLSFFGGISVSHIFTGSTWISPVLSSNHSYQITRFTRLPCHAIITTKNNANRNFCFLHFGFDFCLSCEQERHGSWHVAWVLFYQNDVIKQIGKYLCFALSILPSRSRQAKTHTHTSCITRNQRKSVAVYHFVSAYQSICFCESFYTIWFRLAD